MHVQDVVETLSNNVALRPRRHAEPKKTLKGVKAANLSKPTKADELKAPGPSKLVGLLKPRKNVAKIKNLTRAEVAKKKSTRKATIFGESK